MKIQVAEIFESLSGEVGGFQQGSPTLFLRLSGCDLYCPFCDTKWACHPDAGNSWDTAWLAERLLEYGRKQILITGGEPLLQKDALKELILELRKRNGLIEIQVETNGAMPVSDRYLVDHWVIDCKGEDAMGGVPYTFYPGDLGVGSCYVKFVVSSWTDVDRAFERAAALLRAWPWIGLTISPIMNKPLGALGHRSFLNGTIIDLETLAKKIIESKLPITLNLQLHKLIGVA